MVVQDERVRLAKEIPDEKHPEVLGFVVRTGYGRGRGRGDRPDRSHLTCSHCKKLGHEISHCFEILGYSE